MDFEKEIPYDMVVFYYQNPLGLGSVLMQLVALGHSFVVNPAHRGIAMSKRAAVEIGVYDG